MYMYSLFCCVLTCLTLIDAECTNYPGIRNADFYDDNGDRCDGITITCDECYKMKQVISCTNDTWTYLKPSCKIDLEPILSKNDCNLPTIECDFSSIFRTINGTCNFLEEPRSAAYQDTISSMFYPAYDDLKFIPRFRGVDGNPLPSAGDISQKIITSITEPVSTPHTNLHQVFGQFLFQDIALTEKMIKPSGKKFDCCKEPISDEIFEVDGGPCFPIRYPNKLKNNSDCGNFVRSVGLQDCENNLREVTNFATSFIDGSMIYGATKDKSDSLRLFEKGKLKSSANGLLPARTDDNKTRCNPVNESEFCFDAGNKRVNVSPGVMSLQTIFYRFHNQIAEELSNSRSYSRDETIFQETRRIIGAVIQNIAYNEYLPLLIGPSAMDEYGLNRPYEYLRGDMYSSRPSGTFDSFNAAASRYGHSALPNKWTYGQEQISFSELFLRPYYIQADQGQGLDKIVEGMLHDSSQEVDLKFSQDLLELFKARKFGGNDLVALDIQKGRELGLQPYNVFRSQCGLPSLTSLDAGTNQTNILKKAYSHIDDVDLYVGGLSEPPVEHGIVGPTFACIFGLQFNDLKFRDRFWFENEHPVNYYNYGLSGLDRWQVSEIRHLKFSRVICATTNITKVPLNAFLHIGEGLHTGEGDNPEVDCSDFQTLPKLDLDHWIRIGGK
ncbi:hypothetical protein LOTGIDRAFT_183937 [Lottia gigantea]|uniref:Uncharacterized protein n=1 Tax=Lottia gigantea TaxID=225164 RepID=V3ZSX1_LOTGI|nr:hypothetical protein LOTGIDRAFT_183937 [Lottia gigantea]ESO85670.1 hypothetical protein LOTGIDRAFT_183937 [Lottia gigantea]